MGLLLLDTASVAAPGIALELDAALALASLNAAPPGIAPETDTALALQASRAAAPGIALEFDEALSGQAPVFEPAPPPATAFFRVPIDAVRFSAPVALMTFFQSNHDPGDLASRNVELGPFLRKVVGSYEHVTVALHPSNLDAALVISSIAYDAATQRLSWRQTGGTQTNTALCEDGVTLSFGYRITVVIYLVDGRHYKQSFWQCIADN